MWLFVFTDPDRKFLSARVAAPDREEACSLMGSMLGRYLIANANTHPEPGTILTAFGKFDTQTPRVLSVKTLSNEIRDL